MNNHVEVTDDTCQVMNMTMSLDELGLTNPADVGDIVERCRLSRSQTVRISTDILWTSEVASDRAFDWLAVLMFGELIAELSTNPTY